MKGRGRSRRERIASQSVAIVCRILFALLFSISPLILAIGVSLQSPFLIASLSFCFPFQQYCSKSPWTCVNNVVTHLVERHKLHALFPLSLPQHCNTTNWITFFIVSSNTWRPCYSYTPFKSTLAVAAGTSWSASRNKSGEMRQYKRNVHFLIFRRTNWIINFHVMHYCFNHHRFGLYLEQFQRLLLCIDIYS